MSLGGPAVPIYIVPDADLKKNGGTFPIFGMPATPVTGDFTPPDGSVTAVMINSEAAGNGAVLTANGSGGAAWIIPAFLTQAQGDVRYSQLGAANTWGEFPQTFGGQVFVADGTAANPSIAFASNPTSGIFRFALNQVAIVANGGTVGRFTNGGIFFTGALSTTQENAATNTLTQILTLNQRTIATPATGYGTTILLNLKSSTTQDQNAVAFNALWATATHASRGSYADVQGVFNALALATWLRAGRTGVADSTALWLFREATGALEQVLEGVADSGGTGRKALTVAN